MSAERVTPPRWRRRRTEEVEGTVLVAVPDLDVIDPVEAPVAPPVPRHRPPLTNRVPISGGSWAGRASDHRRDQVRSRGPEPVATGPTGPVDSARGTRPAAPETIDVEDVWTPVVDLLGRDLGQVSVVLSTVEGDPLATHGVDDVAATARLLAPLVAAGHALGQAGREAGRGFDTIQLSAGTSHTVVAAVQVDGHGLHALCVTADGVGLGVLLVRTRQAADELRGILSAAVQ
ncbi:hypothetical protein SAMN04489844_3015 [Nocardioides exalbidus]|uniref:Uncharacterized protein n=1 Tax=Nocardioides exalbidus TaxID=402596 RepID=A0A1H4VHT5_9ACTN|nr:hypothetical protein [Nocardioides exalbidus]SEC80061.1 hypothetical protein SAMN04489844_3015 [Nocardioides exalbidus]